MSQHRKYLRQVERKASLKGLGLRPRLHASAASRLECATSKSASQESLSITGLRCGLLFNLDENNCVIANRVRYSDIVTRMMVIHSFPPDKIRRKAGKVVFSEKSRVFFAFRRL